jgi:hypothetical protein
LTEPFHFTRGGYHARQALYCTLVGTCSLESVNFKHSAGQKGGISTAPVTAGDLKVTKVMIGSGSGPGCMSWTDEGKSFYHVDDKGTVRKISYPDFKEEASMDAGKKVDWLSVSSVGPVIAVSDAQETWILDSKTLKAGKKIPTDKAKRVAASPKSDFAFAVESAPGKTLITVIDLKAGKIQKQFEANSLGNVRGGMGFLTPTFSADGKFLFTTGGIEQIYRYKVDGSKVTFEDTGPRIIQGRFLDICVGEDFVAAPSGGGNYGANYSTFVYAPSNLKTPAVTLASGPYPMAVGFDKAADLFYAQNADKQLIIFDKDANKLKEYSLTPGRAIEVRQFLVHPEGRKLLVLTKNDLFSVEIPKP